MNRQTTQRLFKRLWLVLGALSCLAAQQAFATLAANTAITNTVTVTYSDVSNTASYSATDSITVIVAETYNYVWENYSSGFDEEGGTVIATAANTTPRIYADLFNRGNVLDSGFTLALVDIYGGLVDPTSVPIDAVLCQGDGTIDSVGTVGDDLTCSGDATGPAHTIFAHAIASCSDGSGTVTYTISEDVAGGSVLVGDLVSLDNSATGTEYEVSAVSLAGGAGTDTITINDADALGCTSPTLLQEVQRYALVGELPFNTETAGVPDHTQADVSWQLTGTDSNSNTYSTAGDGVDDRTGTDLAVAILGAELEIIKYTMVVDSGLNVMTSPGDLLLTSCESTVTTYDSPVSVTGTETWYGDTDGTECQVDGVPPDGSIYYWLRLNNAGAKTASSGANCVTDPDTNSDGTHNGTAADVCAGDANFVEVADDYPQLFTTLDVSGGDAPLLDSDCNGTADVQVGVGGETIACTDLGGQICDNGPGTLQYYLGTGANESDATPGGVVAKSTGTGLSASVCLVYHADLN